MLTADKANTLIVGRGVQGKKRREICGDDFVGFVDPFDSEAEFNTIHEVDLNSYDRVLGCVPDEPKLDLVRFCMQNRKHLLIEKPLHFPSLDCFDEFGEASFDTGTVCYTAYNHRFEPHFINMKKLIESRSLGKIYRCRMFYGNGTARLVRNSAWRDYGAGVLPDLGSHLIDTIEFWFGRQIEHDNWRVISVNRFENSSPDHVVIGNETSGFSVELEMSLVMWRNHFTCDIVGELGSAHIESLCKWGPSKFIFRERAFPSGRPDEEQKILVRSDPTWMAEYRHFNKIIEEGSGNNLAWDKNLFEIINTLGEGA